MDERWHLGDAESHQHLDGGFRRFHDSDSGSHGASGVGVHEHVYPDEPFHRYHAYRGLVVADSNVAITAGAGTLIDTQVPTGGDHRQVVVIGDPSTVANVASVNSSGAVLVTEGADPTAAISIAANATSSGSVTGINGLGTATIQLTGTFTATVQVQVTVDGTNWVNVTGSSSVVNAATGAYMASGNLTATGIYQVDIAGMAGVRVITTAYTSGTVTGTVKCGMEPSLVGIEGNPVLGAGANVIGALTANQSVNIAQMNGVAVTMGSGVNGTGVQRVSLATDQAALSVAGVFSVKIDQTTDGTTNKVNATPVTPTANVLSSAATTNGTVIKGSAGTLYSITASNTGAANAFLKLHNSATVTPGTTAVALTITLPPSGTVNVPFGATGMRFGTGICLSITNLVADSDTTAIAAAQVKVLTSYI